MAAAFLERLGDRMRQRRDELGLSRADVARQMPGKVNENQIYRWEKGLHQPNPDTLEALAGVLDCDVAYFMTPEPDQGATPEPLRVVSDPPDAQLSELLATVKRLEEQLEQARDDRARARADQATRAAAILKRIDALEATMRDLLEPPQQQRA